MIHFGGALLHGFKVAFVGVPALGVNGDVGDSGFDEAAGGKAGLAEGGASVSFTGFFGFFIEVEDFGGASFNEVDGFCAVFVEAFEFGIRGGIFA